MKPKDNTMSMFRTIIMLVIVAVVGAFAIVKLTSKDPSTDKRYALAECLTEKGTVMYGAYWCPHCAAQKKAFGPSFAKVDYVECAVPGSPNSVTQECKDANIQGYPTWQFPDGSRQSGEMELKALAERSGCSYGDEEVLMDDDQAEVVTPESLERIPSEMDGTEADVLIDAEAEVLSQPF